MINTNNFKIRNKLIYAFIIAMFVFMVNKDTFGFDSSKAHVNMWMRERDEYRADSGFTPVDNTITEGFLGFGYRGFDTFIWGVRNNKTQRTNEIDIGIGYSNVFLEGKLRTRLALERWEFKEREFYRNNAIVGINYNVLNFDLEVTIKRIIDHHRGTWVNGIMSRKFTLLKTEDISLTCKPAIKGAYLHNFFGATGVSNIIYSSELKVKKEEWDMALTLEYHDGKYHKDNIDIDNSTQVMVSVGYKLW